MAGARVQRHPSRLNLPVYRGTEYGLVFAYYRGEDEVVELDHNACDTAAYQAWWLAINTDR